MLPVRPMMTDDSNTRLKATYIVNVPAQVVKTVTSLPRVQDDTSTIHVRLKRKLAYHRHVLAQNIRPDKVKEGAHWLASKGPLYKSLDITFNSTWKAQEPTPQPNTPRSDPNLEKDNDIQNANKASHEQQTNDAHNTDDSDIEDEDENISGALDTVLTDPRFIEDEERAQVYNVAPGEGNTPLSVFRDKYSEELAFPGIFAGHQRPDSTNRHRPVFYSEIVKSEIIRSDRRVAKSIDNLFFKTKKLQMKQLLDRTTTAIRKCKTQGKNITAGDIKEQGAVNTLSTIG